MGVKKQPDIHVCDRCGHETTDSSDRRGNEEGSLTITWRGSRGGASYNGDWGGVNHKGDGWLCMRCTDDFLEFMKSTTRSAG